MIHDLFARQSPEADWVAGLIASDGCIVNRGRSWGISQSGSSGRETVSQIADLIGYHLPVRTRRTAGQDAYEITATSPEMTADLEREYGIGARKTLVYRWPDLSEDRARSFLQGYVEGDGCVGVYSTPRGADFLHLSFVGTPEFVEGAERILPTNARIRRIERCENLTEVRWNGRYAWDACQWLYEHERALPFGVKRRRFHDYRDLLLADPPRWYTKRSERES